MLHLLRLAFLCPVATWSLQSFAGSADKEAGTRPTIWIVAGTRTGSSTILSMISATPDDNRDGGDVFSLYEPCHSEDKYSYDLNDGKTKGTWRWGKDTDHKVCGDVVSDVSRCDFKQIVDLNGWKNQHTTNDHTTKYSRKVAEQKCAKSKLIAVKTVNEVPLANISWVLDRNPNQKIISVVRDPRGVLASKLNGGVKAREGTSALTLAELKDSDPVFSDIDMTNMSRNDLTDMAAVKEEVERLSAYDLDSMDKMCEVYRKDLKFEHPRVHHVVFDQLVQDPAKISKEVYKFLGMPWTAKQDDWIRTTFDNPDCAGGDTKEDRHADCRSDSAASATKWRDELSSTAKRHFRNNEDCMKVAQHYNFP